VELLSFKVMPKLRSAAKSVYGTPTLIVLAVTPWSAELDAPATAAFAMSAAPSTKMKRTFFTCVTELPVEVMDLLHPLRDASKARRNAGSVLLFIATPFNPL